MEIIRILVQNLIAIVVLAVFLEMLLPASELNKYVRMVMGLLIIVVVVQAAGDLCRFDFISELPEYIQKEDAVQLSGIMEEGKKISAGQQLKAVEQYRRGLSNQVMALARINREVQVIDVDVKVQSERNEPGFGQLKEIILVVSKQSRPADREPVKSAVAEVEPVSVQSGRIEENGQQVGVEAGPSREAVTGLVDIVASFYNLKPEQVKVVYR